MDPDVRAVLLSLRADLTKIESQAQTTARALGWLVGDCHKLEARIAGILAAHEHEARVGQETGGRRGAQDVQV